MSNYSTPEDVSILVELKKPFIESQTKKRKGPYDKKTRKNKYFTYIPVPFIKERLDEVLGFNWGWEVVNILPTAFQSKAKGTWDDSTHSYVGGGEIIETPGVVITGRLTITLPSGKTVVRDGTGGASADKGMGPGDAQKIAASNALKRAAYMFGVGSYLALDSDEALDDTTTFSSATATGQAPLTTFAAQASHLNVGRGTADPPQFTPNVATSVAPNPSPFTIHTTDGKY